MHYLMVIERIISDANLSVLYWIVIHFAGHKLDINQHFDLTLKSGINSILIQLSKMRFKFAQD